MGKVKRTVGKAIDAERYSLMDVVEASKSRSTRVFRGFFGKKFGKLLAAGAPSHKGITLGISDHDAKIEALRGVNDNLANRCESFSKTMGSHHEKGVILCRDRMGELEILSAPAFAISKDYTKIVSMPTGDQMRSYINKNPALKREIMAVAM